MKIEVKDANKEIEIYLNGNKISLSEINSELLESIVERALVKDFELEIIETQKQHPISLLLLSLKSISEDEHEFNVKIKEIRKNKEEAESKLEELSPTDEEKQVDVADDLPF